MATVKTKRPKTPSSIHEFRLLTNQQNEKALLKYMELGRLLYNAVLGEAMSRLKAVQNDPLYAQTVAIPKNSSLNKSIRTDNFKLLNEQHGYKNSALQSFAVRCKNNSKFIDQLGVHVVQKIATRAFEATQKVAFKKAKKVHFKRQGEYVTLEGKNNETFLTYKQTFGTVGKQTIPCKLRKNDPQFEHFLKHRIKFCRLVTKPFGSKQKFFLQVVYEGTPRKKYALGAERTALDIGPSTIAVVSQSEATLERFCQDLVTHAKTLKKLKRKASRKLRLANPQCYDHRGAVIKGARFKNVSKAYKATQARIRDFEQRIAARRKQLHGVAINKILKRSNVVASEKLSYKAFQKLYGKSIAACAPAQFNNRLELKLNQLGGNYLSINTYHTKLSQTCMCGRVKKKARSERTHQCECGHIMQRDLWSAYLALFVDETGKHLDIMQVKYQYETYTPALETCLARLKALKISNPERIAKTFGI